jgi:HAD superfamily phosphatase
LSFSNKCIIFDVDGVLIDTRFSYNIAIRKTVELVFSKIESGIFDKPLVTDDMIYEFRQTGNFNNDTDTAYAILLCNLCIPHRDTLMRNFIIEVVKKATYNGIISVEQYLSGFSRNRLKLVKTRLNYPNDVTQSIVTRIFDEYFYGAALFRKKYGLKPLYYFGSPLINKDRILIKKSALRKISDLFSGRMAIITGRSKLASQYSLGMIYTSFDQKASTHLEDVDRNFRKPNPHSLQKSLNLLSYTQGFYVGDSSEDLIMAKRLNKRNRYNIQFIGVYGASINPEKAREFFLKNRCLAVETVNEIPNILYKVRSRS